MRVLILGGTALTGPYIVRRLDEMGHTVTVFHRGHTESDLPDDVEHIHGERDHLKEFAGSLRSSAPDVVLDMTAEHPDHARTAMDLFRGLARRMVTVSSVDVYRAYDVLWGRDSGPIQPVPLKEDDALRQEFYPDGAHREKILVERAVMTDPDLPGTILRYPMVYGPRDGGRIAGTLRRMDDRRPAILLEEGIAAWRWSRGYAENIALAAVLAVTDERAAGRMYNVAEAEALSMLQWTRRIAQAAGWQGEVLVLPKDRLPGHLVAPHNWKQDWEADTTRIRRELGYSEVVSVDEGLRRTVAWWRTAPPEAISPRRSEVPSAEEYAAEDAVLAEWKQSALSSE